MRRSVKGSWIKVDVMKSQCNSSTNTMYRNIYFVYYLPTEGQECLKHKCLDHESWVRISSLSWLLDNIFLGIPVCGTIEKCLKAMPQVDASHASENGVAKTFRKTSIVSRARSHKLLWLRVWIYWPCSKADHARLRVILGNYLKFAWHSYSLNHSLVLWLFKKQKITRADV